MIDSRHWAQGTVDSIQEFLTHFFFIYKDQCFENYWAFV